MARSLPKICNIATMTIMPSIKLFGPLVPEFGSYLTNSKARVREASEFASPVHNPEHPQPTVDGGNLAFIVPKDPSAQVTVC